MRRLIVGRLIAVGGAFLAITLVGGPAAPASSGDDSQPNWPLGYLGAEETWAHTRGEGVVVGLVDGNVDQTHPDLQGVVIDHTYLQSGNTVPSDHGTSMASLIAGTGAQLIQGLAPDARLIVAGTGSGVAGDRRRRRGDPVGRRRGRHGAEPLVQPGILPEA